MRLFPFSLLAQRLSIGAAVLATAGAGTLLLDTTSSAPEASKPEAITPQTSAPAAVNTLLQAGTPAPGAPAASPALASAPGAAPLKVTTLQHTAAGKAPPTRQFPFVSSADASADARVATRINNLLFIDTFEVLAPARASEGLREVSAAMWQRRPEIDFKVQRNDGRIFSVTFATEGCGAYCEAYKTSYAFDAASGRHLGEDDLFSAAGRAALAKEIKTSSLGAIKAEIVRLKSAKAGSSAQEISPQDRATAIKMYEDCAQLRQSPEYESGLGALQIQAQAVILSTERCSNHALQALDALGNFSARFSPAQLKPWLSPYGHYLLLGGAADFAAPASPWGQVLRGQIGGKLPVIMALGFPNADGSVGGHYFYERQRKPIALFGEFRAGTLTLAETETEQASPPRLVLSPNGSELRGRWEGPTTLDVELAP